MRALPGTIDRVVKLAALAGVVAIGVVSLVPGELRPHVLASGRIEHLAAYAGVGFLFGLAYYGCFRRLLLLAASLAAYAGLLEIAQNFVPGRHPGLGDFLVSSAGAWTGIAVAGLLSASVLPLRRGAAAVDFSREKS
jgi:VanZ like family